jgi:hypothetical protein
VSIDLVRAGFARREVSIAPGGDVAFDAREWRDAIVCVSAGSLGVEDAEGHRARFEAGAILCFDGLRIQTLRNPGPESLVLFAVSRGKADR